jgi:hypothetical protein
MKKNTPVKTFRNILLIRIISVDSFRLILSLINAGYVVLIFLNPGFNMYTYNRIKFMTTHVIVSFGLILLCFSICFDT